MLECSRQTDDAVRVVLALAVHATGARLSSAGIQLEKLIPPALMAGFVAQPARAGLGNTFAGRGSALMLPRRATQNEVEDVVESFEWPILLLQCLQREGEADRPFQSNCPVRPKGGRVQVAMMREMASITFEDLTQESHGISRVMPGFA